MAIFAGRGDKDLEPIVPGRAEVHREVTAVSPVGEDQAVTRTVRVVHTSISVADKRQEQAPRRTYCSCN